MLKISSIYPLIFNRTIAFRDCFGTAYLAMTKQHEALTTFYDPIKRACVTNHMNEQVLLRLGVILLYNSYMPDKKLPKKPPPIPDDVIAILEAPPAPKKSGKDTK